MVDFRYHVVSIVAVFLALGIGIVVGSTAIDRVVIDRLQNEVDDLRGRKDEAQRRADELDDIVRRDDALVRAVEPQLVAGRLASRRVVVIAAPGVDKDLRAEVVGALTRAGARVSAQVRLLPRLADPAAGAEIDDLVARLVPAGLSLPTGSPVERAAAELAFALSGDEALPAAATTASVVAGFRAADLIEIDGAAPVAGSLVVFLTPVPPVTGASPSPDLLSRDALLAVARAFGQRAAATVAGAARGGAAEGSALAGVRADDDIGRSVATVDGVDRAGGRVVVVLALDDARAGRVGHYGSGPGAKAPAPTPVATRES